MLDIQKGMIFDEYTVVKKIGEGGMGEVWLARDSFLDMEIALKILPYAGDDKTVDVERFKREIKLQAMLNHPSIVKSIRAGFANERHYFAMSVVNGHDLNYWLKDGVLHERDALKIILAVAKAMDYAWSEFNMTHRDIKPGNIMIDEKQNIYLMDLGLSKMVNGNMTQLTQTGSFMGTPSYMSPEQCRNTSELDCRSDMYSLGATLYKLLTGHYVFDSPDDNIMNIVTKIALEDHKPASELQPDITKPCDILINGMLEKEPDRRHHTWKALIKDIDNVLNGEIPCNRLYVANKSSVNNKFEELKIKVLAKAKTKAHEIVKVEEIEKRKKKRNTNIKIDIINKRKRTKRSLMFYRITLLVLTCLCAYLTFNQHDLNQGDIISRPADKNLLQANDRYQVQIEAYKNEVKALNIQLENNPEIINLQLTDNDIIGAWDVFMSGRPALSRYHFNKDKTFTVENLRSGARPRNPNNTVVYTWKLIVNNCVQIIYSNNGKSTPSFKFRYDNGKLLRMSQELSKNLTVAKN